MTDRLSPDHEASQRAVRGLAEEQPEASADRTITRFQVIAGLIVLITLVLCLIFWTLDTIIGLVALATFGYVVTLTDRLLLFHSGMRNEGPIHITDEEALAIPDDELPRYTVLVPAFREENIIERLVDNLAGLNYPADKLQVMLLLEEADPITIRSALSGERLESVEVVVVPDSSPRTKPKACNYGLHFATGDLVTIYDAEDHPEPLQLRRVVAAFSRLPATVACIQGRLAYANDRQNMLTRWFASEYNQWFGFILPGLMSRRAPIPLGGTSNHIRRDVLESVGAWDPYNVTEDADLGIRLARHSYETAILDSITYEEANSDPINWVRQRSRWYKGYLQTFLVHTRDLRGLRKSIGFGGMAGFGILMAGTPIIALVNLVFWMMTLMWIFGQPTAWREIFSGPLYIIPMISLVVGNAAVIYMGIAAARHEGKGYLAGAALLSPAYWVLMALGSLKAHWQLITRPSYWEKTAHGLDGTVPEYTPPVDERVPTRSPILAEIDDRIPIPTPLPSEPAVDEEIVDEPVISPLLLPPEPVGVHGGLIDPTDLDRPLVAAAAPAPASRPAAEPEHEPVPPRWI